MLGKGFTGFTTAMIYLGTLLLSVLSFFTTLAGMRILLDNELAIIGSLGLQIAMLGIAWNLMKIKDNRLTYISVFSVAAAFSIFFSYANFDSNLKSPTRSNDARQQYALAARPVMTEYALTTREAVVNGRYQVERLQDILKLEEEKGWATVSDEGSGDPFIQSVIDGARRTVGSWKTLNGTNYGQGSGRGIIVSYLESQLGQAQQNLQSAENYLHELDSLSLAFNSTLSVASQHNLINRAWVRFPSGEVSMLLPQTPQLSSPPSQADFVETATTRQQAFMLVIHDLIAMDSLALFSLLLALAIDLIVILMAFAGSYIVNEIDYLFDRVRMDTTRRIRKARLDDKAAINAMLDDNLEMFRGAGKYGLEMIRVLGDYQNQKKKFRIVLKREGETKIQEATSFDRQSAPAVVTSEQRMGLKNRMDMMLTEQEQD